MQIQSSFSLQNLRTRSQTRYAKLNLVSLMDIFTILVFFLLLNSGDQQVLQNTNYVKLPESKAETALEDQVTIVIGRDDISLGDTKVASISDVMGNPGTPIPGLEAALTEHINSNTHLSEKEKLYGRSVTVMGDQEIPYAILKSIMTTCSKMNYRDISLAVTQVVSPNLSANAVEG
jgi:biopolymer transport protein ExbD